MPLPHSAGAHDLALARVRMTATRIAVLFSVACCVTGLQCGFRPLHVTPAAPASCGSRALCMLAKKAKGSRSTAPSAAAEAPPAAETPVEAEAETPEPAAMPLPDAWEPVFPAEQSQWATHRVVGKSTSGPSIDQVIERLRGVGGDEQALGEFCRVNRDLLDFRCMYKLTAYMLRAQNTRAADVDELRQLHNATLRQLQVFDAPLFQAVKAAEGRLGQLLAQYVSAAQGGGEPPSAAECTAAAGEAPLEVFAFWLVVRSAAAAWRDKLGQEEVAELASAKLGELVEVAEALEADAALVARGGLVGLPQMLALGEQGPPPAQAARGALAQLVAADGGDDDGGAEEAALRVTRRLGCVAAACQRHAYQSYNPMVLHAASVYDVLLTGAAKQMDTSVDIAYAAKADRQSRLIEMAYEADGTMPPEAMQLYW